MRDADSLSLEARSSHGRSLRHPGSDPDVAAAAADAASKRDEMPVNQSVAPVSSFVLILYHRTVANFRRSYKEHYF